MRRWIAVALATLGGSSFACLLQLDEDIACGDGFVDVRAGEECDPGAPDSYEDGCVGTAHPMGRADCDPMTCQVINDASQCAICGDGIVDIALGEECDQDSLNGQACPGGNGVLQCDETCRFDLALCDACGNGVLDPGEECDYNAGGGFVTPRECGGSNLGTEDEIPPLPSPTNKPFTSGQTSLCREDCRYDRAGCGFCGDGVRDDSIPLQDGVTVAPEWCDGQRFDPARLESEYGSLCNEDSQLRPSVACGDDCRSFVEIANGCCLRRNSPSPYDGNGNLPDGELPCCYGLTFPDETPYYSSFEANGAIRVLCK